MPRQSFARHTLVALTLLTAAVACEAATSPAGDALTGARFTMTAFAGIPLPAALDADTFPGTAHYTLLADTLRFDGRGSITEVQVNRLDYVGGTQPSIVQRSSSTLHYTLDGDVGTAIGTCSNECVPLQFSFSLVADTGLTFQSQNARAPDTYRRFR